MTNGQDLRSQGREAGKLTGNLGHADPGHAALLAADGVHAHRIDFIRAAIRARIDRHGGARRASAARRSDEARLGRIARAEVRAARDVVRPLDPPAPDLAPIADDVRPERAWGDLAVLGARQASAALKAARAGRPDWTPRLQRKDEA